jgi:hypothetical protein
MHERDMQDAHVPLSFGPEGHCDEQFVLTHDWRAA